MTLHSPTNSQSLFTQTA